MKKKIIFSFFVLFVLFTCGSMITALNIKNTTSLYGNLVKLHQIEDLRHDLVERVLKVQSDLYTVNTPLGRELDAIIENVESLDKAAEKCNGCHHEYRIAKNLSDVHEFIIEFKNSLSFYITASSNKKRIELLKGDAAAIGNELLRKTEEMSFSAARNIENETDSALTKVKYLRLLLLITFAVSCLFGILVAVNLTRSITRPTQELVSATRNIAAGELGYTISNEYEAEFAELARNFNSMSISLKSGYTKLQKEIAERKQTEEALRRSEERYALAARGANDGLWDWDMKTQVVYFSPRWKSMIGYGEDEIGHSPEEWLDRVHPDDRPQLEAKIAAHIDGPSSHFENEQRILHKDGVYRWTLTRGIALRDPSGAAYRMAGSQTDISERKMAEEALFHDAFHDALTDLPNRALFKNRLQHVINAAQRRHDYHYSVIFIDLDRFKLINDSLGHLIGDQLLIAVGKRLLGFLRPIDTVARLGGDEFAILLEDIKDSDDAINIAKRIQRDLPLPFNINGHDVFTTASIGITMSSSGYKKPDHILRDADLAMYQAKANGKARYEIFDETMHESTIRHLKLETDLRKAIERNEFRLQYQPILSLSTNRITGFEALLRWQHPNRGIIYPTEFISVAEETGLIASIGQWVLREACREASLWQRQFPTVSPLTINLNLSTKEFNPLLVQQIKQALNEAELNAAALRIEITESTIMNKNPSTSSLLLQLKELGIGLHIDDFGTGYSSLSYLHHFPIDALKIDQSFVKNMNLKKENLEIVKTIIDIAHNLNMKVIAEGVETTEELRLLKNFNCEYAQGYCISKPLDSSAVNTFISNELRNHQDKFS